MNLKRHILYLTVDGLLEPLGTSQVARVMKALGETKDYEISICSLEKKTDRGDGEREAAMERDLLAQGITWYRQTYSQGGPLGVVKNLRVLTGLARTQVCTRKVDLIHARSYVAAHVARQVGADFDLPYLFDMRGFWVDERIEQGRWFRGGWQVRAARRWEEGLIADAAGLVVLTEEARQEVLKVRRHSQKISPWSNDSVVVIPTCVDYGEFGLGGPGSAAGISHDLYQRLQASLVVGFVGAVDQAYCVEESLRLFDHILALRPDAHLLCLTRNSPALLLHLERAQIPTEKVTLTSCTHEEMPRWLAMMDWGLLLRKVEPSHRGAMPTKLAEFFASGVRPIQYGCNREVRYWVKQAQSGVILPDLFEESLRNAARQVAEHQGSIDSLLGARWRTAKHFDLREAVKAYDSLYKQLIPKEQGFRVQRSANIRILFLTEGKTIPASRFRVEQFLGHFEAAGLQVELRYGYGTRYSQMDQTLFAGPYKLGCRLKRFLQIHDAHQFDLLFLQRPALPYSGLCEALVAGRPKAVILDIDDAIFVAPDGSPDEARARGVEKAVAAVDRVICGNQYLANSLDSQKSVVIPTVVDTEIYRPATKTRDSSKIIIGWMGTASNFVSLRLLIPLLTKLLAENDHIALQIVSNQPFEDLQELPGVEEIAWSATEELSLLQGFDVGIMPLVDNPSTQGKCGFKALQYMAVGLPVVASAVGANVEILKDSGGAILAGDEEDFLVALHRLIASSALREKMGRKGRKWVEEHYSIQAVLPRYLELFHELCAVDDPARTEGKRLAG